MKYLVPRRVVSETFRILRHCGRGQRECQVFWVSSWENSSHISVAIHPRHSATAVGVQVDPDWIGEYWQELAASKKGIRVQIHSHPGAAFHSAIDDAYPIIHQPQFLSLVIPNFGLGPVGFKGAHLAEILADGSWGETTISERLMII